MKPLSAKAKTKGLTLIELLVVVAVIVVLAALLLPALADRGGRPVTVFCISNQKQIAIGFAMWKEDHNGQFPWQVAATNGGTLEAATRDYAAPNFQCLSDFIRTPNVFICRTDTNRIQATNFTQFRNQNVSYLASLDAGSNAANSILTGDRNLANNNKPLNPGLFTYSRASDMNWTRELHGGNPKYTLGVFSFNDGHVEAVKGVNLNSIFQRENLATNRLIIP